MICKYCNKKVVLVPSAGERAKKYGGSPRDYERLFPTHSECQLKENAKAVSRLMRAKERSAD